MMWTLKLDYKVCALHASVPDTQSTRQLKSAAQAQTHGCASLTVDESGSQQGLTPFLLQWGPGPAVPRAGGLPRGSGLTPSAFGAAAWTGLRSTDSSLGHSRPGCREAGSPGPAPVQMSRELKLGGPPFLESGGGLTPTRSPNSTASDRGNHSRETEGAQAQGRGRWLCHVPTLCAAR